MKLAVLLTTSVLALAQTGPSNGSISGVVRDAAGGAPLENVVVSTYVNATWVNGTILTSKDTRQITNPTDRQGRYSLKDLPPGEYNVNARPDHGFFGEWRMVTLAPGQELTLDFAVQSPGTISGRVIDDNKEPVPNMTVYLVTREYFQGALRYFMKGAAQTDDRGNYSIGGVLAGSPYLIMTQKRVQKLAAISEEPADIKLRRRAVASTFYPNSLSAEGGAPITLRSGERREGVDIRVQRTPSYCVEGATAPAADVGITEDQPSAGMSSTSGFFVMSPTAQTAEDGKFRFCGLHPGLYRVAARHISRESHAPAQFGATVFAITDEDVRGLKATLAPGMTLKGEFAWDGAAPEKPLEASATLSLSHLYSAPYMGEQLSARGDVPSEFTLKDVPLDEYAVRPFINSPGVYVKDVTYGGLSVLHTPLRLGSAIGDAGVKVTLARDGGGAAVTVTEDNKPVGDAHAYIFPADAQTEAELQERIVSGSLDQNGNYQTGLLLAPGKYYAIALRKPVDPSPESIGKLLRARIKAKEVEIAAGQATQVNLEPVSIE